MLVNPQRCCKVCAHSHFDAQAEAMTCHRYPPANILLPTQAGPQVISMYPATQAEHRCGEFQPDPMVRAAN